MTSKPAYELLIPSDRYQSSVLAILFGLLMFLLLSVDPLAMVRDGDTEWHIAAGDLMRSGGLPGSDPWSFTAGDYRWYSISWLWDMGFSWLYEFGGWHAAGVVNSALYATMAALVFLLCLLRSHHGVASFIIIVGTLAIMQTTMRPLQVSALLVALLYLALELVSRNKISTKWLWAIPPITVLWANMHGGFIVGGMLVGIYGLAALIEKNYTLFKRLFLIGLLSLGASLINPNGIDIYYYIVEGSFDQVNTILSEWMPLQLSKGNLIVYCYVLLFFLLMIVRPVAMSTAEKIAIYMFLMLSFSSVRMLVFFCIFSAPVVATSMAELMRPKVGAAPPTSAQMRGERLFAYLGSLKLMYVGLLSVGCVFILSLSPVGATLYGNNQRGPILDLSKEVAFIQRHYPETKFYSDYAIAGSLIFQFRGAFPVFIDGRVSTAYPSDVIADFMAFHIQDAGWQDRFDARGVYGIMLHKQDYNAERMRHSREWRRTFEGKEVEIFIHRDHVVSIK